MTLEQYWTICVKQWRLIAICIVVVGLGAYIGSRRMTPIYQSTALVQIAIRPGNNQLDYYNGLLASDQLVQTDAILATSDPVLREVASHYSGLTSDKLSKEVTATPKTNTQLFAIDVQNPSPTQAANLANDIAATFIQIQQQLVQKERIQDPSYLLIAQPAQPASNQVRPNVLLNTSAGLLTGLLLGVLLAILLEQLDTRIRTPKVLIQLLGWPILATIWKASSNEEVVNPKEHSINVESYHILRTNIGFSSIDKPLHTLMVASATVNDGKSAVAANLAIYMAKAGKKTLLIDADLRRPTQHTLFGLSAHIMGFSNAILESSSTIGITNTFFDPFVHAGGIPNLFIMPSGPLPPNPPELLDSKAMERFFAALSTYGAEVVIFDTPALLGLSDARILASKVDGTLIVVDITRAYKGHTMQMKSLLIQAGACVIGCVVNKQRRSRDEMSYSYYYYGGDELNGRSNRSTKDADSTLVT